MRPLDSKYEVRLDGCIPLLSYLLQLIVYFPIPLFYICDVIVVWHEVTNGSRYDRNKKYTNIRSCAYFSPRDK